MTSQSYWTLNMISDNLSKCSCAFETPKSLRLCLFGNFNSEKAYLLVIALFYMLWSIIQQELFMLHIPILIHSNEWSFASPMVTNVLQAHRVSDVLASFPGYVLWGTKKRPGIYTLFAHGIKIWEYFSTAYSTLCELDYFTEILRNIVCIHSVFPCKKWSGNEANIVNPITVLDWKQLVSHSCKNLQHTTYCTLS